MTPQCCGAIGLQSNDAFRTFNFMPSVRAVAEISFMSATAAAAAIANGSLSSEQLVQACLAQIELRDAQVHAWQHIDAEAALQSARAKDQQHSQEPMAALHGIPVGLKDVIDTADMPTTQGSSIYEGALADADARCVQRLKQSGAIILGKTVTAEFATYHPGPTANPSNIDHTPGGSSSGSAAAVADGQVPIAIGTQTAGSVIRPASYCGVFGFKPSFGRYDTQGVLKTSPHLDTLGVFARSLDDIKLVDRVLCDEEAPHNVEGGLQDAIIIGVCRTPVWDEASDEMQATLLAVAKNLKECGFSVVDIVLPEEFNGLCNAQQDIHAREAWQCLGHLSQDHPDKLSAALVEFTGKGRDVPEAQYQQALELQRRCTALSVKAFAQADVLLTPSATGSAPQGLHNTGSPAFNRLWTAVGTPCVGFPAATSENAMPLGLQLIGAIGSDQLLLRRADRIMKALGVTINEAGK